MPVLTALLTSPSPVGGSTGPGITQIGFVGTAPGPAGPTGSTGPTGPAGSVGATGPAGVGANFRGAYNAGTTYALNDAVYGTDLNWYISLAGGNVGNNPVTDAGVHWLNINGPSVLLGTISPTGLSIWAGLGAGGPNRAALANSNSAAFGHNALGAEDVGGANNVAMGQDALWKLTDANACTAIGSAAVSQDVHGTAITGIGDGCLQNVGGGGIANINCEFNTALGENAGLNFLSGVNNVFVGHDSGGNASISGAQAGNWITLGAPGAYTGNQNTAVGDETLGHAISGNANVAVGYGAMGGALATGGQNIAIGQIAMNLVTSGSQNIAIGASALTAITTGTGNVMIGFTAGQAITTNTNLVGVGPNVLNSAIVGAANLTAVGSNAMGSVTTATTSVAVGTSALSSVTNQAGNTAVGHQAQFTGTGANNTAIGMQALKSATASNNTAVGNACLGAVTSGASNTAVGQGAGGAIITTASSTCLGLKAGNTDGTTASTDSASMTLLGEQAQGTVANVIVLGKAIATRPNLAFGAVGAAALFGTGRGVFAMAPAVTNPSTNPTGATVLYIDSATSQLCSRDPNGVIQRLSPVANGTTTLVAGTKVIANASVTAAAIIKTWNYSTGGTVGALSVVLNAGVGFTINSTNGADTSKIYYEIVNF